jgi:transposase-like protein
MSGFSITPMVGAANTVATRTLYSPRETEQILGVSHATLYRLIAAGRLDARKLDAKTVITAESIGQLIAALPKAGRQT